MAKQITHYVCQECGWESPKWQGQCGECGKWNSLVETVVSTKVQSSKFKVQNGQIIKPIRLNEVKSQTFKRIKTGIGELDRVLGSGIVPGSVVLLAGQPGIGKSTLLTQLAMKLANVLYICGEESPAQVKLRIDRFSSPVKISAKDNNLLFLPETNLENILATIGQGKGKYGLVIVDSIQTLWTENLTGSAGSVGQVRQCSNMLLNLAKKVAVPVFLIGHITKGGTIAGPKVLEHLVDTVLYLEGDQQHEFRILRASKNRFGSTDEVGVFIMTDKGMEEVKDPSRIFLSDKRQKGGGQVLTVSIQGIRPMLVEIQALVVATQLAIPRRVASGIDQKRLQVICAVLQKKLRIPLGSMDVFVSVTGGLKLKEPAADLGIALAIVSSFKNKSLAEKSVCLGEVGLLGELRKVSFMEKRIKQAKKLGYRVIIGEKERDLRETLKFIK